LSLSQFYQSVKEEIIGTNKSDDDGICKNLVRSTGNKMGRYFSKLLNMRMGIRSTLRVFAFTYSMNRNIGIHCNDLTILPIVIDFLYKKGYVPVPCSAPFANPIGLLLVIDFPLCKSSEEFLSTSNDIVELVNIIKSILILPIEGTLCPVCGLHQISYINPKLCLHCYNHISLVSMEQFLKNPTNDFKFTLINRMNSSGLYKLLFNKRKFYVDLGTPNTCVICGFHINSDTSWLSSHICNPCSKQIDWMNFISVFEGNQIEWDEFLKGRYKEFM